MRLHGDRGDGPVGYIAVILLVAVVTAAVTVVAVPNKVTGSIQAAACRVVGQECDGERTPAANPSTPSSAPSSVPSPVPSNGLPGPGEQTPGGPAPVDQELQSELDAFNRANQDYTAAESELNAFDLLSELAELGFDFLFGDIVECVKNPNLVDCLWALIGIIPWGKLGKFLRAIPKLIKLADRFLDLRRRLDRARDARNAARTRFLRERPATGFTCAVPAAGNRYRERPLSTRHAAAPAVPLNLATAVRLNLGAAACPNFSSAQNALNHWNKHRSEFPGINNAKEYLERARTFVTRPPDGTLMRLRQNADGTFDRIYFNPRSNEFAVITQGGQLRTFFKPDPAKHGYPNNLDYFRAQ